MRDYHGKTDPMKRIAELVLVSLAIGPSVATVAASDYKWIGQITEDGAALSYAIADSDGIKLDFHCDRKTRKIVVNYDYKPKTVKDGLKAEIQLSIRGRDPGLGVIIPAAGSRQELDDLFTLQGETRMSPSLRRILSEGGSLLVTVENRVEEIPLKGIAVAARQLFAACPF
jgi:hypothetical protein